MDLLAKETLLGRALVETVHELVSEGRIHPDLAKLTMHVLDNKPNLPFLNQLEITAGEMTLFQHRGNTLEMKLQDVSLDRVFNHVYFNHKRQLVVANFAHVKNLTIYAYGSDERHRKAYLQELSRMLNKDVSELKEHILTSEGPGRISPSKNVTVTKSKPVLTRSASAHAKSLLGLSLQSKQKTARGRPKKVPTPLPDLVDSLTADLLQLQVLDTSRRPSAGYWRTVLPTCVPQTHVIEGQGHATDSTAPGDCRDTGRTIRGRGRGRDAEVISLPSAVFLPAEEVPGQKEVQEDGLAVATATTKSSSMTKKGKSRPWGKSRMFRGSNTFKWRQGHSEDSQEALQEAPQVSENETNVVGVNDAAGGPVGADRDKQPGSDCGGGVAV